jgi:hypothetical protein
LFIKKNKSVNFIINKRKFLKFLYNGIKDDLKELEIEVRKFDQCKEVRNLNVPYNRDNFINLTVLEVILNNKLITVNDYIIIKNSDKVKLKENLSKKIKDVYQFSFLKSNYFKIWLNDPIKIYHVNIYYLNII